MEINEYQRKASSTVQNYTSEDQKNFFLGYLGLAGEAGSVLTTLKKYIRDGDGFGSFDDRLKEELGDVLWYIASIASHYQYSLEEIVQINLQKTNDRFLKQTFQQLPVFDELYGEKFPDEFIVDFSESSTDNGMLEVSMKLQIDDGPVLVLGDPLTDNSRFPNEYRFHDVFHLGHVAYLGWSPVIRHLMKLKRKSDIVTLDAEDRGRAQVAEEAITLIIYNYAQRNKMLKESSRIDTELLSTIKQLCYDLEVSQVSAFLWEEAIIKSYEVFHKVVENRGGQVLVSLRDRKLDYIGKK